MRTRWRLLPACLLLVAATGVAAAHEVGGSRFDAPIPLPALYVGAGLTVVATGAWLARPGTPGAARDAGRRLAVVPERLAETIGRAASVAFLLAFLLAVAAGLLGPRAAAENAATLFVWAVWIKGIAIVAALVGSPWRALSPWRTVYRGLARLEGGEISALGGYPSWLGAWPALVGFVAWVGIVENLTAVPRSPGATTALIAGYAAAMLVGGVAYGEEWFERADALAVLYRLIGRVAPFRLERSPGGGYALEFRYPWVGPARAVRDLAAVGFVVATVFTVSFDGFTSTPEYQAALALARWAVGPGLEAGVLLYAAGFALFLVAFAAAVAAADAAGGARDVGSALLAFGPTVLPIAVAYEVAHNYPFVARNLAQLALVAGRHVLAEPTAVEPLAWLSLPAFWASQVALIVGGHVVAVVAAHNAAANRYPNRALALRAHVPLTALMVGYTVLSLWIVSRPVAA